tara:strand:+ start:2312 stop:2488 length:177 start_codon:yes stop_codon:yes gene_type:complete
MNKFKTNAMWSVHNLIAHPLSEIFHLASYVCCKQKFRNISNYIHDSTIPKHKVGEGRG